MQWIVFGVGLFLIAANGLWQDKFNVDITSIIILFILSIPFVAKYLRKAKIGGTEFEFKDEILETEKLVNKSIDIVSKDSKGVSFMHFETFQLKQPRALLNTDPVLSLAALRIEIEKKLRAFAETSKVKYIRKDSLLMIIRKLHRENIIFDEQKESFMKIVDMCNKSIHGYEVSKDDAKNIIELSEKLNRSFAIGYSVDMTPNSHYEKNGLFCEWEHCIENMPITSENTELSCPVFGHNCPGGVDKVKICGKTLDEIPEERFLK